LPDANVVGYSDAHSDATNAVSKEWERKKNRLQEDSENTIALNQTREAIEKSKSRLVRLDTRVAALSKGSGDLATALSELVPLIQDDHCPVCDRDFSEVSTAPLRAHLATHISSLSRMANELREVVTERQAENTLNEQHLGLLIELQTKALSENVRNTLVADIAHLSEASQQLSSSKSLAIQGETLDSKERSASSSLSVLRRNQESLRGLRTSAETFPKQLELESTAKDESLSQTLARCSDAIVTQQNEIDRKQAARRNVAIITESQKECEAQETTLRTDLKSAKEKKGKIDKAWTNADKTRELGKTLSDKAVSVRTDIVRRVFNESLNEIWKDLFIRLAPDERFIPAFAFPSSGNGPVVASLETIYRGENRLGNPRSMLSAGNLNTAALTLFMSLNLSVKPTLPWLVIDDPVQSMDEIHIAQFAALLRTLSRQQDRQVIIAVHEKPLFDYLALELSPAYEGDRLVTIELSRSHDQNTEYRYEMKTWDPNSVFSVPVAV
jgi:DNA repair protein SbcC/Rad50